MRSLCTGERKEQMTPDAIVRVLLSSKEKDSQQMKEILLLGFLQGSRYTQSAPVCCTTKFYIGDLSISGFCYPWYPKLIPHGYLRTTVHTVILICIRLCNFMGFCNFMGKCSQEGSNVLSSARTENQ